MRHTRNTYNILRKAFNTHEVLESHSLVIPWQRSVMSFCQTKSSNGLSELMLLASVPAPCPSKRAALPQAPSVLVPLDQTLPTVLETTLSAAKTGRNRMNPEFIKYSTACNSSCVFLLLTLTLEIDLINHILGILILGPKPLCSMTSG